MINTKERGERGRGVGWVEYKVLRDWAARANRVGS